jgi:asparagine synthase (glutamine-hydrolysing)
MCGIAGIVGSRAVSENAVRAMTDIQAHRGPDDSGLWRALDGRAVLGHRRLSIIDVSEGGHQPMELGGCVITYNGEIYNYLEIRERLKSEGVAFQSDSDTEVLLAAYKKWGEKCLTELNGMFAFAIYDPERRVLFCARDRFGEKPFLFHAADDWFAFTSEFKALFSLEGVETSHDNLRLLSFLQHPTRGLDDGMETIFDDILQLPPAHCLTVDLDQLTFHVRRYWDVSPNPDFARMSQQDAEAHFRDLLTNSVSLRMRSDVSLGSCLSGGLDSSSIVCIARSLLGDDTPYDTFTGRFPGSDADESPWAEKVTNWTRTRSHTVDPDGDVFVDEIGPFMWHNELPIASTSQYAQWCVFRLAKEQHTIVLLDGQGGDELLGGYEQYFSKYLQSRQKDAGPAELETEIQEIRNRYPLALLSPAQERRSSLPWPLRSLAARLTGKGSDFSFGLNPDTARKMLSVFQDTVSDPSAFHPLSAALYEEALHTNLPVLLRYGDRNSMAHSREVRLPFCDHRIAEFTLSLGAQTLMGNIETKRLLRGALAGILPDEIRTRWSKQGFLPPQARWLEGRLGVITREIIESPDFRQSETWCAPWWRKVWKRFEDGETHLANLLWRPFIDQMWRTHFLLPVSQAEKYPIFEAES